MVYIKDQLYKCRVFKFILTYILITFSEDTLKYYMYIKYIKYNVILLKY